MLCPGLTEWVKPSDLIFQVEVIGREEMNTAWVHRSKTALLATGLAIFCASGSGHASELEEIIVTAQKQEQRIQDVGIAISALSGDQIDQLGLKTSVEVANQVPGLASTNVTSNEAFAFFSIRGVVQTDFNDNQEAPVAVYEDETYFAMPSMSGVPLYDLDRVEVLLGPQGTLFGRNATGGLLHFVTAKPTEELEGSLKFSAGSYNLFRGEGAVSGPLTERILGRFAFRISNRDGYVDNNIGPDLREEDSKAFRGQLLFKLGDNTDLLAKVYGDVQDDPLVGPYQYFASDLGPDGVSRFCQGCGWTANGTDDGDDNRSGSFNVDPEGGLRTGGPETILDRELYGATVTLNHDAETFSVTSITDFKAFNHEYGEDSDATEYVISTYFKEANFDQFSQELRVNGETSNLNWIGGLYYLQADLDASSGFQFPPTYVPAYFAQQDTKSIGVFGQVEVDVSDTLSLSAGARWTKDEKDLDYVFTCLGGGEFCIPYEGFLQDFVPREYSRSDDLWTAKVGLEWAVSEDQLVYASVNRGTKGGGFNAPLDGFLTDDQVPFKPEKLMAYEIGYKGTHAEGRLQLNASAYYYDYSDYQAFFFTTTTTNLFNTDAEIYGGEVSLLFAPAEGWDVVAGLALMDTSVDGVPSLADELHMILAPEQTANVLVRKEWFLGNSAALTAQVDANYVSKRQFSAVKTGVTIGDSYFLTNARVQYTAQEGRWQLGVNVHNLFDEEWREFAFDITAFGNYTIITHNVPRMVSADIRFSF